jgi:E2 ubiquitin ligase family protein
VIGHQQDVFDKLMMARPPWATISSWDQINFICHAQPARGSGKLTRAYDLVITIGNDRRVTVKEHSQNRLLPTSCPQRHINDSGTFCIGLRAETSVVDESSAKAWWQNLEIFLTCQETAEESGLWPPELQLSHGDAADFQVAAEQLAKKIGQEKAYQIAVAYDEGMIAELSKRVSRLTGRLSKKREACVCGYTENGRPKRRWQCARDNNPCLPVLEARRRRAEASFWRQREAKFSCCETMKICPLKKAAPR